MTDMTPKQLSKILKKGGVTLKIGSATISFPKKTTSCKHRVIELIPK